MNEYTFIPCNERNFPYYKAKKLFNVYINEITKDKLGFTALLKLKKPYFYGVLVDGDFKGCLYIDHFGDNYCEIAGFSRRKQSAYTIQGIKYFCSHLFEMIPIDYIQAETSLRYAAITMLKAGFKKQGSLLVLERDTLNVL